MSRRPDSIACGKKQTRREFMRAAAALAAVGASGTSAWTQGATMPPGPWSIIIPTASGGQADVVSTPDRQQNGGDTWAAVGDRSQARSPRCVAEAEPNGSTLLFVTGAHSILPGIHRATINFDAVKDFEFISTISTVSFIISSAPGFAAKTFPA